MDERFRSVSNLTRNLPEFTLSEKCKPCIKVKKKKWYKYKRRFLLNEGEELTIPCPE